MVQGKSKGKRHNKPIKSSRQIVSGLYNKSAMKRIVKGYGKVCRIRKEAFVPLSDLCTRVHYHFARRLAIMLANSKKRTMNCLAVDLANKIAGPRVGALFVRSDRSGSKKILNFRGFKKPTEKVKKTKKPSTKKAAADSPAAESEAPAASAEEVAA